MYGQYDIDKNKEIEVRYFFQIVLMYLEAVF